MDKKYRKYMGYGKHVTLNGYQYELIEQMAEDKDTVAAVRTDHVRRYELLTAWERHRGLTEEEQTEKLSLVETLDSGSCEPADQVRFITPHYQEKFRVNNLGTVLVNGQERTVVYDDEYHFAFVGGWVYHICEFAERCEAAGIIVEPA